MIRRAKRLLLVVLIAAPVLAFTAFGGWAVVTVQDVPEYAVAGTPVDIVYEVRQHGFQLQGSMKGTVEASSGEMTAQAKPVSVGNGRFKARLTFTEPGQWKVIVNNGWAGFNGEMLPIKVVAAGSPTPAAMSPANRGRHLFVAKGCVSCHSHQLTAGFNQMDAGPDLTEPKFVASYLERFLADPSIKKDWKNANRMPDLGLKPAEITSIVAFLNRDTRTASR